jgi:hypothetical protein
MCAHFSIRNLCKMHKTRDNIALDKQGSSDIARKELFDFVECQVDRLATLEERFYAGEKSSLRIFCRIDVGLLWHASKLHYFVHEVERGPSACLFGRASEECFTALANKFLNEFLGWVVHRSSTMD